jgi:hypothetical protein
MSPPPRSACPSGSTKTSRTSPGRARSSVSPRPAPSGQSPADRLRARASSPEGVQPDASLRQGRVQSNPERGSRSADPRAHSPRVRAAEAALLFTSLAMPWRRHWWASHAYATVSSGGLQLHLTRGEHASEEQQQRKHGPEGGKVRPRRLSLPLPRQPIPSPLGSR